MDGLRRAGAAAVLAVALVSGCGGGGGGGGDGASGSSPSASVSPSVSVVSVDDALAAYQQVNAPGCSDAASCQSFMTAKLAAAVQLREAMQAEDPARYAEPIADVERAERLADHYGRDNLAARGNMMAVNVPLQDAIRWLSTNR